MTDKIVDFAAYRARVPLTDDEIDARIAAADVRIARLDAGEKARAQRGQLPSEDVIPLRDEPTTLMVAASALARAARLRAQLDATASRKP